MTTLGVFRDDFYNAASVLAQSQIKTSTQNGGVIAASLIAGAGDCYSAFSGQAGAQALTTDTAANIIAQLQQAVQQALNASSNPTGQAAPAGVPNLFNVTFTWTIVNNNNTSGAITLTGGAGVTVVGTNTVAINTVRVFVVQVTSPNTVTITNVGSGTN